jgi:hypothetical protein
MKVIIGARRLEFLFLFNHRGRRRDHLLFHLVNTAALFPPLFFQNEPVVFCNLGSDIGLDCLIDVGENIMRHQLRDYLMRF